MNMIKKEAVLKEKQKKYFRRRPLRKTYLATVIPKRKIY